jgi:hypothetical protein
MSKPSYLPRQRDLGQVQTHYEDADFAQAYPALYDLLCTAKRDGKWRPGARLGIFCDDGKLKASLWDEHTKQVWFATLESFQGALEAIEKLLQDGRGEWRERKDRK